METNLSLDPKILEQLNSYDEFLGFYIQLEQSQQSVSWLKADLFVAFSEKLGADSLATLAKDIKIPASTIVSYIRTSKAFPVFKRLPDISFSHHLQASLIDSFDGKEFSGEGRYKLAERASDEKLSTRQIASEVKQTKEEDPEKKEAERKLYRIIATLRNMFKEGKYSEIDTLYKQLIA